MKPLKASIGSCFDFDSLRYAVRCVVLKKGGFEKTLKGPNISEQDFRRLQKKELAVQGM